MVDGAAADIDDLSDGPGPRWARRCSSTCRRRCRELVDVTLKWSRNEYAEALLLALDPTAPATAREALAVLRETLAGLGVAAGGYTTRDGSGLSRNDYLSADALVATLTAAWERPELRGPLDPAPAPSRAERFARQSAEGDGGRRPGARQDRVDVQRAVAGRLVETTAGEALAFAFLVNGFDVRPAEIDARVDEMLLSLVALPDFPHPPPPSPPPR